MPRIVVLGANSFSGQDFVDLLLDDAENEVIGISRSEERDATFLRYRRRADLTRFRYAQLDMNLHAAELRELLDEVRPSHIVNFAAQSEVAPSWEHPEHWFQTNCVALAELVNHLARQDYVERYLHISSPEVYGTCVGTVTEDAPVNPSTPYAASKAAADMLLASYHRHFGFPVVTVRATNVYGAGQQLFKIIPRCVISFKSGRTIPLHGGGRAVKSYIHIRDISRGEYAALFRGEPGTLYHLAPEQGIAVRDVVATICMKMEQSFEDVVEVVAERLGQDAAYVIDASRARSQLDWRPQVTLDEGIAEVVQWVDDYWDTIRALPLEYQHKA